MVMDQALKLLATGVLRWLNKTSPCPHPDWGRNARRQKGKTQKMYQRWEKCKDGKQEGRVTKLLYSDIEQLILQKVGNFGMFHRMIKEREGLLPHLIYLIGKTEKSYIGWLNEENQKGTYIRYPLYSRITEDASQVPKGHCAKS